MLFNAILTCTQHVWGKSQKKNIFCHPLSNFGTIWTQAELF